MLKNLKEKELHTVQFNHHYNAVQFNHHYNAVQFNHHYNAVQFIHHYNAGSPIFCTEQTKS